MAVKHARPPLELAQNSQLSYKTRNVSFRNMFQSPSYKYTWFFENRATKKCQSLALIGDSMALVT